MLLHQTPRSGDEFAEVIEALGDAHDLIAIDLPSMGHSSPHPDGDSIEAYAAGVADALRALDIGPRVLVGHHTGAAVAATLAAGDPDNTVALVLSSPPWIDDAARARRRSSGGTGVDHIVRDSNGSHLQSLWDGRAGFYPPDRSDLLDRFISDALLVDDPSAGHRAVTDWDVTPLLAALRAVETVLVDHVDDPHAHPHISAWADALPLATQVRIDDGMVPLEFTAERFADVLAAVLSADD